MIRALILHDFFSDGQNLLSEWVFTTTVFDEKRLWG
jgi:hypothetical protein